eukprot:CAMPEP_0184485782 /NCGR_PEP_ID=MMETSP0113_2-20130426/7375_1 /TAXON_ID=91329 /ORGANISM="Norrisiella sphaerica, Strain BC52" /LENGTH=129 /DNA_ID=CAMNT_0026867393 /DNA_START=183 /DNA_END=568 /DNA_ORIENTATION=-
MTATNAKIVLSTFWRKFDTYLRYVLSRFGIKPKSILGITPGRGHIRRDVADIIYESRSHEILAWLAMHPYPKSFVILDDREYAGLGVLKSRFVHTSSSVGITDRDAQEALKILRRPAGGAKDPVLGWLV